MIKLAGRLSPLSEEYSKLIETHKKLFMKQAGVSSKSAAQNTEEANRLLQSNMATYLSIDEIATSDIENFNNEEFSIPADLLLPRLEDAILPHEIRNALKDFLK